VSWDLLEAWAVYWYNFWFLALGYLVGKGWVFPALGGFALVLHAARQEERKARLRPTEHYRTAYGGEEERLPYDPARLRERVRR